MKMVHVFKRKMVCLQLKKKIKSLQLIVVNNFLVDGNLVDQNIDGFSLIYICMYICILFCSHCLPTGVRC